jgi:hypothetical protein
MGDAAAASSLVADGKGLVGGRSADVRAIAARAPTQSR